MSETTPATTARPRWKRWLRRGALALLALVVLLAVFHRPLLRWGANVAASRFAKSQGLTFSGRIEGSVTGDLRLRDVKLAGDGAGFIREISVGEMDADYDLWELRGKGPGSVLKDLTLRDAVVDLDLTKSPSSDEKEAKKASSPLPDVDVPRVDIENATVRLRDAAGVTEFSGLTLQLRRGESGRFHLDRLALPAAGIDWHDLTGTTAVEGQAITFRDVQWDTPLKVHELTVDLARLSSEKLPVSFEITRGESRIAARGELTLGGAMGFDGTADLQAITPGTLSEFVTLPADQRWRAERAEIEWHGPFDSPAAITGSVALQAGPVAVAGYAVDGGTLRVTLTPEGWQIDQLVLERSGGVVRATGTLQPPATWTDWSQLGLTARADFSLPRVQDVFTGEAPVAGSVTGNASVTLAGGKVTALSARAAAAPLTAGGKTFELAEVDAAGTLEQLEIARAHARLSAGNEATVSGTGSLTGAMPFDARWQVAVGDLPALARWLDLAEETPLPAAGTVRASGTAAATVDDLKNQHFGQASGTVEATAERIVWNGAPVERASLAARLAEGVATLSTLSVIADDANRLLASGTWQLDAPHAFTGTADVDLTRLGSLSGWSELFGGPRLEAGSLTADWKGGGTLDAREIDGQATVEATAVKVSSLPEAVTARLSATHRGQTLEVPALRVTAGPVTVEARATASPDAVEVPKLVASRDGRTLVSGRGSLPLKTGGKVPLDPARPLAVSLTVDRVNVSEFVALAGQKPPVRGVLTASVEASGQWPEPILEVHATAADVAADATADKLDPARATLDLSWKGNELTARVEAVQRPLKPLQATVSVPLSVATLADNPQAALEAPLEARVTLPASDLAPLRTFVPAIREARGTVAADVTARGTLKSPRVDGTVRVDAPVLRFANAKLPELRDIRVAIDADATRARLTTLHAGIAGGTLDAGGSVDWSKPAAPVLDLTLRADEALVMRDDLVSVRADAALSCRGRLDEATVAGRVELVRGRVYKEIEFLPLSLPGQLPPPPPPVTRGKVEEKTPGFADKWKFDVAVTTRDDVRLLGNVLNGAVTGNLRLGGTGAQPWLEGTASTRDARVRLPFSQLKINRGIVAFTKENPFEPTVDLQGDSFVNGYLVNVTATGPALDPKLRLSSSPPLPEGEIATLLATGATTGDLRGSEGEAANRAAFLLISQTYRRLFNKAGVPDRIDDDPPRLNFSFSVLDTGTSQRGVNATYELSDHWQAVGAVGQRGTFRGLLYYLIRFR